MRVDTRQGEVDKPTGWPDWGFVWTKCWWYHNAGISETRTTLIKTAPGQCLTISLAPFDPSACTRYCLFDISRCS